MPFCRLVSLFLQVHGYAMRILLPLVLFILSLSARAESVNYCYDAQANAGWKEQLSKNPNDNIIMGLFALRMGLCQLVDGGVLTVDRATAIFEASRVNAVRDREKEEDRNEVTPEYWTG